MFARMRKREIDEEVFKISSDINLKKRELEEINEKQDGLQKQLRKLANLSYAEREQLKQELAEIESRLKEIG